MAVISITSQLRTTDGRMNALFHVSEERDIERFEPRMPPTETPAVQTAVVWAVAQSHLGNYLLPRECPRVAFRMAPGTTEEDRRCFMGPGGPEQVVVIESRWFERAANCTLWLYEATGKSRPHCAGLRQQRRRGKVNNQLMPPRSRRACICG